MGKSIGLWILVVAVAVGVGIIYEGNSEKAPKEPTEFVSSKENIEHLENKNEPAVANAQIDKEPQNNSAVASPSDDGTVKIDAITCDMQGKTVIVSGIASGVTEKKDTVFFTLRDADDNAKSIKGVMFKKTNDDNEGRKELLQESERKHMKIYIKGKIDIYKNELEIKAWQVFIK